VSAVPHRALVTDEGRWGVRTNEVKTMRRRKFLIGAGSLAASGAAALGTGAFDSAQINDRDFEATIRWDNNSNQLLRLNDNLSQYATIDGDGKLLVSIDALAQDSEYSFSDLFRVENNGREDVSLQVNVTDNPGSAIQDVPAHNNLGAGRDSIEPGEGSIPLNSGGFVDVGADVKVGDGLGTFDGEFTIIANEI